MEAIVSVSVYRFAVVSNWNGLSYWSMNLYHIFEYKCVRCKLAKWIWRVQIIYIMTFYSRLLWEIAISALIIFLVLLCKRRRNAKAYWYCTFSSIIYSMITNAQHFCSHIYDMTFSLSLCCFRWVPWFAYLDASGDILATCQTKWIN